jgi:hypothetical protein
MRIPAYGTCYQIRLEAVFHVGASHEYEDRESAQKAAGVHHPLEKTKIRLPAIPL